MPIFRWTLIVNTVTSPSPGAPSGIHAGGFSESYWTQANDPVTVAQWTTLMTRRAAMFPANTRIVGARISQYDMVNGVSLIPQGSTSNVVNLPGTFNDIPDIPQMALMIKLMSTIQPNISRSMLRAIPDAEVVGGEYDPGGAFQTRLNLFRTAITNGPWGFIGRNQSFGAVRVGSLVGNQLTTSAAIPGVAAGDSIRFIRVRDDNGKPISGTFGITAAAGNVYTISPNPQRTVSNPNGLVRKNGILFVNINATAVDRAVVKKVGRPFQLYRGRRSKVRA